MQLYSATIFPIHLMRSECTKQIKPKLLPSDFFCYDLMKCLLSLAKNGSVKVSDCYQQPKYGLKNIRLIQADLVLPVLTWRVQALHLQGNLQLQDWGSSQQQFKYEQQSAQTYNGIFRSGTVQGSVLKQHKNPVLKVDLFIKNVWITFLELWILYWSQYYSVAGGIYVKTS